jgi:hypothetical protein
MQAALALAQTLSLPSDPVTLTSAGPTDGPDASAPPSTLSIWLTADVTPALELADAREVGGDVGVRLGGAGLPGDGLVGHGGDAGSRSPWHSWTLLVPHDPAGPGVGAIGAQADQVLRDVVAERHPGAEVVVTSVQVLTAGEAARVLTAHAASAAARRARPPGTPSALVNTEQFAAIVGVTPARIRQLRIEREAAGEPNDFPAAVAPRSVMSSGLWQRADAEAYAATRRP